MIAKKLKKTLTLGLLAAFICSDQIALAQTGDVETGAVTVTATRTEKDLREVPVSVGVVTSEDLKKDPQTNVADMLASMPGVTVTDGSMPGGKRISIRGESPTRSLILIDGVKISEQKSMSGSAILIDTSQIERIEVIKGPASVLYGSEAIGGVINIITKKGGTKPVGFSQNFILDSSTNSVDIQSAIFGAYKGFNYRFSGSGINADDRKAASGTIEHSSFDNSSYAGRLGYDWDKGSLFVRAERYESKIEVPISTESGVIKKGMSQGYHNTTNVSLNLPQWDRESLSGGLEFRNITDHLTKIKFDVYGQNTQKDFYNNIHVYNVRTVGPNTTEVIIDQNIRTFNDQDNFGGSFQSEWLLGDHFIIAGADYNLDKLAAEDHRLGGYTQRIVNGTVVMNVPSATAFYEYKADQSTVGVFLQDEWSMSEDFAATLGLRQTWIESKLKENNNPNLPSHGGIKDSNLVANLGLVYSGFDDWALRAMWSQGYRVPSVSQLYLGTVHGQNGRTLPNPDLMPETSSSYELGARFNNSNWNFDVALFYTDAENYITTQKIGATSDSQFANMNQARTYGVELGLDYTFAEYGLTPYATTTFMRRQVTNTITDFNNNRVTYKTYDTQTPPLQGKVGLKWQKELEPSRTVYADAYVNWATGADYYRYDSTYEYDFITEHDEGWQTINLTLGTKWGEEQKWNASLSLRNIGDQSYTQADNSVEDPGFHVVLGVGFEY